MRHAVPLFPQFSIEPSRSYSCSSTSTSLLNDVREVGNLLDPVTPLISSTSGVSVVADDADACAILYSEARTRGVGSGRSLVKLVLGVWERKERQEGGT